VVASLLVLGADVWSAFLHNLPGTLQVLELEQLVKGISILTVKIPTLLAALLLGGCPLRLAKVLQPVVMPATGSIVVWV